MVQGPPYPARQYEPQTDSLLPLHFLGFAAAAHKAAPAQAGTWMLDSLCGMQSLSGFASSGCKELAYTG